MGGDGVYAEPKQMGRLATEIITTCEDIHAIVGQMKGIEFDVDGVTAGSALSGVVGGWSGYLGKTSGQLRDAGEAIDKAGGKYSVIDETGARAYTRATAVKEAE